MMVSLQTPVCQFGWQAPEFNLPGVDGEHHTLTSSMGGNGLLVMFICNHCPYVQAILPRLVQDCRELQTHHGIHSIAIMSNDPADYPEDSFDHMAQVAAQHQFPFPYVIDETQEIARAYQAVCTPDFFGFNRFGELQYRGRFNASRKDAAPESVRRDLFEAMAEIASTQRGPLDQIPSMGCSIKWKHET
jgi:peroxiredoxin